MLTLLRSTGSRQYWPQAVQAATHVAAPCLLPGCILGTASCQPQLQRGLHLMCNQCKLA